MKSQRVSCSVLSDSLWPMYCSPPGFSVHGILQARKLERVATPFSRACSWPEDRTWVSCIVGRFFTIWATREVTGLENLSLESELSVKTRTRSLTGGANWQVKIWGPLLKMDEFQYSNNRALKQAEIHLRTGPCRAAQATQPRGWPGSTSRCLSHKGPCNWRRWVGET